MKSAIVSGATGFIGSWLVRELKKKNIRVLELVRKDRREGATVSGPDGVSADGPAGDPAAFPAGSADGHERYYADLCDYGRLPEILPKTEDCVFYHLAWDGVYGPKRTDVRLQFENAAASEKAVAAAKELGCVRFIEPGSIMEREITAIMEADGIRPSRAYIYGEAKHLAHLLTMSKAAELGLDYICPILTNPYGEYDTSTRFINVTLKKIINGEPLEFTSGTQMYDFIHIRDVCRALILLGEKGKPFGNYLIGSGEARPLREFIKIIGETLAPDRELLFGNVPYSGALMEKEDFSIESLKRDTGFACDVDFKDGITGLMDWLRTQ